MNHTLDLPGRNFTWQVLMRELKILDNLKPRYERKPQAYGHNKRSFELVADEYEHKFECRERNQKYHEHSEHN